MHPARWQTFLLGCVFFLLPGMYNAVTSIGGGISDQGVASASVAILYAFATLFSFAAAPVVNQIGPRLSMSLGTTSFLSVCPQLFALN